MRIDKYLLIKIGVTLFLVIQLLAGLGMKTASIPEKQVFPFSEWDLFSRIPNISYVYEIRVKKYNDKILPVPKNLSELEPSLSPGETHILFFLTQFFGQSLTAGKQEGEKEYRRLLEVNHLYNVDEYELVLLTYNPLEMYFYKKVKNVKIIKHFNKEYESN